MEEHELIDYHKVNKGPWRASCQTLSLHNAEVKAQNVE